MNKTSLVHVGTFGSPVGLKGEVKVIMLTSSLEFFKKLNNYVNEEDLTAWIFTNMRLSNNKLIVHPQDCNNRDDAEKLRGKKIFTKSNNFPKTKEDQYYVKDLIGCTIYMIDGLKIGNLIDIENFGAGNLLEVATGKKKIYIPMNQDNVVSIDQDKRKIIVNPIKGIIE